MAILTSQASKLRKHRRKTTKKKTGKDSPATQRGQILETIIRQAIDGSIPAAKLALQELERAESGDDSDFDLAGMLFQLLEIERQKAKTEGAETEPAALE